MMRHIPRYGFEISVPLPFADALERTREALSSEGFGVLTEADISATLKNRLDVDFPPYVILGACNPPLAHRALTAEREIGLLLPCNVIVYADEAGGATRVAALDPVAALSLTDNDSVEEVALEVRERLQRVLSLLASG